DPEAGAPEVCACMSCAAEVGAFELCVPEVCACEVCPPEVCAPEVCAFKACAPEVCAFRVCAPEVCAFKVCPPEVSPPEGCGFARHPLKGTPSRGAGCQQFLCCCLPAPTLAPRRVATSAECAQIKCTHASSPFLITHTRTPAVSSAACVSSQIPSCHTASTDWPPCSCSRHASNA